MPAAKIDIAHAEHYVWGQSCDGWHLVKTPGLSVIEERMPPGAREVRHSHATSRQYFYVLAGEFTIEVEHHLFVLQANEGIEVAPGRAHQAMNQSHADVRILVTSVPPSHGDRVDA